MAIYQCKSCGAVYMNPQRDGASYFHSCAPTHNPAYEAQFTLDEKGERRAQGPLDPTIPQRLERLDKRDENVTQMPDGKTAISSEGKGRDTLPPVKG